MSEHIAAFVDLGRTVPKNQEWRARLEKDMRQRFESQLMDALDRNWELPLIVVKHGEYLALLREARDLYIGGYFYSCVAMCGIVGERLIKDVLRASVLILNSGTAESPGDAAFDQLEHVDADKILKFLNKATLINDEGKRAAETLATLRNRYPHARGHVRPAEAHKDAKEAIERLHLLVEATVSAADLTIQDGATIRITTD